MTYWFAVGQLSCAVVSDGQMEPPLAPPLEAFFAPGTGVPDRDLRQALAAEGQGRTMVRCGYNCLLVETPRLEHGSAREHGLLVRAVRE